MYFRDGVGASAKVYFRESGGTVKYKGRIWDRKGDGWHARIYGYSLGQPFGIRKATQGQSRTFRGEVTCTRRWTYN